MVGTVGGVAALVATFFLGASRKKSEISEYQTVLGLFLIFFGYLGAFGAVAMNRWLIASVVVLVTNLRISRLPIAAGLECVANADTSTYPALLWPPVSSSLAC